MKFLTEKGSNRIYEVVLSYGSIVYTSSIQNLDEELIEITLDQTEAGVPISRYRISLLKWLNLTEQAEKSLRKAGLKPSVIRQFLARGA